MKMEGSQLPLNQRIVGSGPTTPTNSIEISQLVPPPPEEVQHLCIERKPDDATWDRDFGWAVWYLLDPAKAKSDARRSSLGTCREAGADWFVPISAMTQGVTSAPPSAAGRRSVAAFPRTAVVESRFGQDGT